MNFGLRLTHTGRRRLFLEQVSGAKKKGLTD